MINLLTPPELATILAALRYWQRDLADSGGDNPMICEHFDATITPLSVGEIDSLCERLNLGSAN